MNPIVRSAIALCLSALIAATAHAAPPPTAAREIDQLLAAVATSRCQFQRNGQWHSPAKAQAHLRKKYDWLRKRDQVASAEQFIARAGSQSSLSGRAYTMRCPGQAELASAAWLQSRLRQLRRSTAPSR